MSLKHKMASYFRCMLSLISPELNTKVCYRVKFGKKLDLNEPKTFNEKILYLKLRDFESNELVRQCADKYRVREYIKSCGCEEILNPLIAHYYDPSEIDFDALPDRFALKWNFGCGYNIICDDKEKLDYNQTVNTLKKWKNKKPWLQYSEMQYKDIKPVLLAEEYLCDGNGLLPLDYKVYCFNGKPYCVMICTGREKNDTKYYFFDRDWNYLRVEKTSEEFQPAFVSERPKGIEEVFRYAEMICKPFEFVRADFYIVNNNPVFGEMTFTPAGGMDFSMLSSADEDFGSRIHIGDKTNVTLYK